MPDVTPLREVRLILPMASDMELVASQTASAIANWMVMSAERVGEVEWRLHAGTFPLGDAGRSDPAVHIAGTGKILGKGMKYPKPAHTRLTFGRPMAAVSARNRVP